MNTRSTDTDLALGRADYPIDGLAEVIPPVRLPLFEVRVHLADQTRDIRIRALDRTDAIRQVLALRRGWAVGAVLRYHVGRWSPA